MNRHRVYRPKGTLKVIYTRANDFEGVVERVEVDEDGTTKYQKFTMQQIVDMSVATMYDLFGGEDTYSYPVRASVFERALAKVKPGEMHD